MAPRSQAPALLQLGALGRPRQHHKAFARASGVAEDRIAQVVGKAGSEPLYPDNTIASANRRISIVLLARSPGLAARLRPLTPKAGVVNDTGLAAPPLGQILHRSGRKRKIVSRCVRRNRLIS